MRDGLPVDTLFYGDNPYLQGINPDTSSDSDVEEALRKAKKASVQESSQRKKELAREAVAALDWFLNPEEEAAPGRNMAAPEVDAPVRGLPAMTSTSVTESASVSSEKERTPIEESMQEAVQAVFDEYEPRFADDIADGQEPDYDGLKKALIAVLVVYLVRAFMDEVATLEAEYDVSFDPAELAAVANEWAMGYAPREAERLIATTQKTVNTTALAWAAETVSRDELDDMLHPAFNATRAILIAITLITVALSRAFDSYRDMLTSLGFDFVEIWETAGDDRVCRFCAPLDGTERGAGWTEPPPLHGRCRCRRVLRLV